MRPQRTLLWTYNWLRKREVDKLLEGECQGDRCLLGLLVETEEHANFIDTSSTQDFNLGS